MLAGFAVASRCDLNVSAGALAGRQWRGQDEDACLLERIAFSEVYLTMIVPAMPLPALPP